MLNREMPKAEGIRVVRGRMAENEAYLRQERRNYTDARKNAEMALNLAGGSVEISPGDHAQILTQRGLLLIAEICTTTDMNQKQALAEKFRHLADQVESPRFDIAREAKNRIATAKSELVEVELLLFELREERRAYIDTLLRAMNEKSGPEVVRECCALLEEDIQASLAAGDLEGARRSTASLESVRTVLRQRLPQPEAEHEDLFAEIAHDLAAQIIGDRQFGVDVADARWFEQRISHFLARCSGEDGEHRAVQSALREYRSANRRSKALRTGDVDPKSALVDGAL